MYIYVFVMYGCNIQTFILYKILFLNINFIRRPIFECMSIAFEPRATHSTLRRSSKNS